ncbi:MAG: hypothetical protein K8S98_00130, partial [Planctomycetes bacterium]|nr:hypothetical protein [Planctomycetota bacterium]
MHFEPPRTNRARELDQEPSHVALALEHRPTRQPTIHHVLPCTRLVLACALAHPTIRLAQASSVAGRAASREVLEPWLRETRWNVTCL